MICNALQEWSDDESSSEEELIQPNRDFPISDDDNDEEVDEEYDMYELTKLTLNKKTNDDFFKKPEVVLKEQKEHKESKEPKIQSINIIDKIKKKRQFNPRLPPPNKYSKNFNFNSNFNFNLNINDFPNL